LIAESERRELEAQAVHAEVVVVEGSGASTTTANNRTKMKCWRIGTVGVILASIIAGSVVTPPWKNDDNEYETSPPTTIITYPPTPELSSLAPTPQFTAFTSTD
jgi:hypothetical protein